MAKQSQVDKAIAVLQAERDVLDLAIEKLREQQASKPKAKTTRKSNRPAATPADNGE